MKKMFSKILILLVVVFIFSEQALALKCGHRIIDVGAKKSKVISRCGEPLYIETRERKYPFHCIDRLGSVNGDDNYRDYAIYPVCSFERLDVWTYNFGSKKFMRELIFRKGILTDIILLDYGE
jgi:hypothetical protein